MSKKIDLKADKVIAAKVEKVKEFLLKIEKNAIESLKVKNEMLQYIVNNPELTTLTMKDVKKYGVDVIGDRIEKLSTEMQKTELPKSKN